MLSVVIATKDSERALVRTLSALVPGASAGMVREVIVVDDQSRDDTREVADIAGCQVMASAAPLGALPVAEWGRGPRGKTAGGGAADEIWPRDPSQVASCARIGDRRYIWIGRGEGPSRRATS